MTGTVTGTPIEMADAGAQLPTAEGNGEDA